MKNLMYMFILAMVFTACGPSIEEEISAIETELEQIDVAEYCTVSISYDATGARRYLVDTNMVLRDDNFIDCMVAYCSVMGAVGRAIESDEGTLRVGTVSLWMDMPMQGVHRCLSVSEDEILAELDKHLKFVDR